MSRKDSDNAIDIDMTPMIDCVFLLLIFFMCATKFRMPEGALSSWLPRDRGTASSQKPVMDRGCRISLQREGDQILCWADEVTIPFVRQYAQDSVGISQADFEAEYGIQGPDLGALEDQIAKRKAAYRGVAAKGMPLIIDFMPNVPARYVVDVMNICKRLEIEDVAVAAPEEAYE
jgi:biopolymer transport protein ExbD